jgi:hypothetical protein
MVEGVPGKRGQAPGRVEQTDWSAKASIQSCTNPPDPRACILPFPLICWFRFHPIHLTRETAGHPNGRYVVLLRVSFTSTARFVATALTILSAVPPVLAPRLPSLRAVLVILALAAPRATALLTARALHSIRLESSHSIELHRADFEVRLGKIHSEVASPSGFPTSRATGKLLVGSRKTSIRPPRRASHSSGSRVAVELNGVPAVFHRPHPAKEMDPAAVRQMRKFLTDAGVER